MTDRRVNLPSGEVLKRALEHYERVLSPAEAAEALAVPLSQAEIEEKLELIRWFRRRYPTPLERSAYVRRAWRRWMVLRPLVPGT